MTIHELKKGYVNKEFNKSCFIKNNIISKLEGLHAIHIEVLNTFFKQGKMQGSITAENKLSEKISQCYVFTNLYENIDRPSGFERTDLYICLNDLETRGFVVNVRNVAHLEYAYAITDLGISALLMIEEL
ncbi:hypothetical protein [Proteiniborus sp. MB09-C3]|uniref:hypothetical protein n=1 Tax=Proteiniborus sp. MB09-C3 TaxID=3050072 RepID=UPI0025565FEA|nr:hypothetical protein [Proteiniborus sp. MB09-C3]WIV11173.1 hypothetical protein QO263_13570 [Proteiniborus sp. MB09-C3]